MTTARPLALWIADVLRRHWIFTALVVVGALIRLLAMVAYRPAFMFFGDSFSYIIGAQRLTPPNDRPFGYSALLRLISFFGDLELVVVVQHLAGIALALAVYAVLARRGTAPWLAALVTSPLLLDAYLIQIEQNILSETMFAVLLVAAVLVVTKANVTPSSAAVVGVLLAAATMTRNVALPIAALFVGYLIVRRVGWRPLAAFGMAMAIPVIAYMGWFAATYGMFATNDSSGRFLYGRVAVFADCTGVDLTAKEAQLCDNAAPALRPNANFYVWSGDSPVRSLGLPGTGNDQVAGSFSRKVILDQPLTYGRYVAADIGHYFAPGRFLTRVDSPLTPWQFPESVATGGGSTSVAHNNLAGAPIKPGIEPGPAAALRAYQSVVYTQGPLLLLGLVMGVAAGWLERGRRRWDGPFAASVGLAVIAIPSLTVMFDYRYGLPAIPLLAYAGGIGAHALQVRRRARAQVSEPAAPKAEAGRRQHRRPSPPRPLLTPGTLVGISALVIASVAVAPMAANASFARYVSYRAELGPLGPPLSAAKPIVGLPDGSEQEFVTGSIVADRNNAAIVPARYRDAITRVGGYAVLGAPRDREQISPYTSGERFLRFDNGVVFWSRLGGTRVLYGDIYETWNARKVKVRLQEPLADALTVSGTGAVQRFVGGQITRFADGSVQVTVTPAEPIGTKRATNPGDSVSGATSSD